MLHFLEVIVRRDSAVKSQVSDFRFAILSYVCWFGGWGGSRRRFSNLSWGCSSLGEGNVIPHRMHLNGFLKNIPQN